MPRIATCTSCHEQVTLPDAVDQDERVRCPICNAQYELNEVQTDTFESEEGDDLPPELSPVIDTAPDIDITLGAEKAPEIESAPVDETAPDVESIEIETEPRDEEEVAEPEASGEGEGDEEAPQVDSSDGLTVDSDDSAPEHATDQTEETEEPTPQTPAPAGEDKAEPVLRVRCPTCEAEFPLGEMVVVDTGEPLGSDVAAAVVRVLSADQAASSEGLAAGGPRLDVWAKADSVPQIDLGEGGRVESQTADAAAFQFGGEESRADDAEASVMEGMARRREKQKGGWRTLVGPVVGGIGGLVIAYYLLNFIRGEAGNFLKIPLPGVSHTYKYSPDWFPGFLQPSADDVSQAEGETIDFESIVIPALPYPVDKKMSPQPPAESPEVVDAEKAPPKEKELPDGYVGLVDAPTYTAEELHEVLDAAEASVEETEWEVTDEAYGKLCRLAEVVTFVDRDKSAKPFRAVASMLGQVGETPVNLDKIGFQAGALCVDRDRQESGIVLAGKVLTAVSEGKAHGAQVQLAASGRTITVAGKRPLGAAADDDVLILGRIVDDPAENLAGFDTKQPVVVWVGMVVKVE